MSDRTTDQLAREVRPWLFRDGMPIEDAVAALAELEAQAEAGQRNADTLRRVSHILENIADPYNERIDNLHKWATNALDVIAAAAPPPADQEEA